MDQREGKRGYLEIVVRGVVQGVGFRPFVSRLANSMGVFGSVRNAGGEVHIRASGSEHILERFVRALREQTLSGAKVERLEAAEVAPFEANGFRIDMSAPEGNSAFFAPDISVCADCLLEVRDSNDRRFLHPFNSCVSCGPRFGVVRKLPYDRANTSMDEFPLCPECEREYAESTDRRFYAQTVCCNHCGPELMFSSLNEQAGFKGRQALLRAVELLRRGAVLMIKGVGGYHLACSPYDQAAVRVLRQLKARDSKPFAVMFEGVETVRRMCEMSVAEEALMASPARPITLLDIKNPPAAQMPFAQEVLRGEARCGCFLPYTALHQLLLDELSALVLTSANLGGGAIITEDRAALEFMREAGGRISGILYHARDIVRPIEDSVAQVVLGVPQVIRRARGYVPGAFPIERPGARDVLALGGDLKAAFCLVKGSYAYPGSHFGDLMDADVYDRFRASTDDFVRLFSAKPALVVCDMHPGYLSRTFAEGLGLPIVKVQHHHAHIASVMAEHGLKGRVIGVAFDGTGYGEDGAVWGGEFLVCERNAYRRAGHLAYVKLVGGDTAARDAMQTAYCYLGQPELVEASRAKVLDSALKHGVNTCLSSSMGRLFDAVAAALGACALNSYEGECAIALQRLAESADAQPHPLNIGIHRSTDGWIADGTGLIHEMYALRGHADIGALALGFHHAVAELVLGMCVRLRGAYDCDTVALSGGVFQNRLLLSLSVNALERAGFCVCFNQRIPPNDGGLSLGQAYLTSVWEED